MPNIDKKQKAVKRQMRNRELALPRSLNRLEEMYFRKDRKKQEEENGIESRVTNMWVNSATLAKINFALAKLRSDDEEGEKWQKVRLKKKRVMPDEEKSATWEIWLEDKKDRDVEGIEEFFPG